MTPDQRLRRSGEQLRQATDGLDVPPTLLFALRRTDASPPRRRRWLPITAVGASAVAVATVTASVVTDRQPSPVRTATNSPAPRSA